MRRASATYTGQRVIILSDAEVVSMREQRKAEEVGIESMLAAMGAGIVSGGCTGIIDRSGGCPFSPQGRYRLENACSGKKRRAGFKNLGRLSRRDAYLSAP